MHLILCIDQRDGMSFCGRRLSSDIRLTEYILQLAIGSKLWMNEYSANLFPAAVITTDEDFLQKAAEGEYCFAENVDVREACEKAEKLVIYRWNRHYPADVKFPLECLEGRMRLEAREEFPGSSHDTITWEVYGL